MLTQHQEITQQKFKNLVKKVVISPVFSYLTISEKRNLSTTSGN